MLEGAAAAAAACALLAAGGCARPPLVRPAPPLPPPAAVELTDAPVPPSAVLDPVIDEPVLLARATTWTLALDDRFVYYGDASANALRVVPKGGGPPITIGGNAPWGIALLPRSIAWIGAPGNVVLRGRVSAEPTRGPVDVLREGGVTTTLAARGEDLYLAEVDSAGGALLRMTKDGWTRLATLDAQPRALAVDDSHVYVQTSHAIERVPRTGDKKVERVAVGVDVAHLAIDSGYVYTTARVGPMRSLVRAPKTGGELDVVEEGVRDAPIAVFGPHAFYFDANRPALRRVPKAGGPSEDAFVGPALWRITALALDASGIYVGTEADGGGVLAAPLPREPITPRLPPRAPLPTPPPPPEVPLPPDVPPRGPEPQQELDLQPP